MGYHRHAHKRHNHGGKQIAFWIFLGVILFLVFKNHWWIWVAIAIGASMLGGTACAPSNKKHASQKQKRQEEVTYYTPPQSQPVQPQERYQGYEQGYQVSSTEISYEEKGSTTSVNDGPQPARSYADYERPQAEYPQQMPPM